MSRLLGAVLAGGRSSRFGSNKAEARLGGLTLVEHAAAALRPYVDEVVVIGAGIGGLPDLPRPDLGPLGGIAAALDHAAGRGFACVLTIGCDMPEVPGALIEALLRREPSYCADAPVLGLWQAALGAQLLAYLETATDRSVRGWARTVGALPIPAAMPLANVNTPADLRGLEQDALVP
ncbi:molybdenum cofactor guanylyltransferase [Sphingomonas rubra]|uniref:Molybdopterin-guanine dinucleotide biosynthesis protein A n=1 Tax=Sphingomonas rubra TaxID=634430 RepID=A0A1I5SVK7_9SPHN|nr:molybdenum cofactor guanylyltransferase [Sphingomonas rubra]SFP74681.1 molybdopterin-guanine dinucleotide biosynthesis protein A [Sphingomonas rubra]